VGGCDLPRKGFKLWIYLLFQWKRKRQRKRLKPENFIKNLNSHYEEHEECDDRLWIATINKMVVQADGALILEFKDGNGV
jgi:hypothetical protein